MIIGIPNRLCFLIERVPEWENETSKNGMMFLCVEDDIYPDCIRTTTINSELCALTASNSAFMNPVIEPDIFSLEENELFSHMMRVTYPENEKSDNDYRYEWDLHEINDAGFRVFSVANGHKVKILVCRIDPIVELMNVIEMDCVEYNKITQGLLHFYEEVF